eukprot:3888859-Amphidinium_carterae.1
MSAYPKPFSEGLCWASNVVPVCVQHRSVTQGQHHSKDTHESCCHSHPPGLTLVRVLQSPLRQSNGS